MGRLCSFLTVLLLAQVWVASSRAQSGAPLKTSLGFNSPQKSLAQLPAPEGLQDRVANGKLVLSLDDSIRLALANNTDIHIDRSQIDFALDNLGRAHSPFDPVVTSNFSDGRGQTPTTNTNQGATILDTLSQSAGAGYSQTFQTGTNF